MYAEDIYITACEMAGGESELLRLLCQSAESEFLNRLRSDVNVEEIKPLFVTASAMLACAIYGAAKGESVKSWSAGQVSVTGTTSWTDMRENAEMLLAGYIDSGSGFDFRGVIG